MREGCLVVSGWDDSLTQRVRRLAGLFHTALSVSLTSFLGVLTHTRCRVFGVRVLERSRPDDPVVHYMRRAASSSLARAPFCDHLPFLAHAPIWAAQGILARGCLLAIPHGVATNDHLRSR